MRALFPLILVLASAFAGCMSADHPDSRDLPQNGVPEGNVPTTAVGAQNKSDDGFDGAPHLELGLVTDAFAKITANGPPANYTLVHGRPGYALPIRRQFVSAGSTATLGFLDATTQYYVQLERDGQIVDNITFFTASADRKWSESSRALVQPGDNYDYRDGYFLDGKGGGPTGGWILRDATNSTLYQLTAGHAPFYVGQTMRINHTDVGKVAAKENMVIPYGKYGKVTSDWMLVAINETVRPVVSPAVAYWGGPTGILMPKDATRKQTVCTYGWGQQTRETPQFRHRCGGLIGFAAAQFSSSGTASDGDSGSPMITYTTGEAVGIVLGGFYAYDTGGHTLCFILQRLQANGFDLALAKAPFNPPPADVLYAPAVVDPYGYNGEYACPPEILGPSQP